MHLFAIFFFLVQDFLSYLIFSFSLFGSRYSSYLLFSYSLFYFQVFFSYFFLILSFWFRIFLIFVFGCFCLVQDFPHIFFFMFPFRWGFSSYLFFSYSLFKYHFLWSCSGFSRYFLFRYCLLDCGSL